MADEIAKIEATVADFRSRVSWLRNQRAQHQFAKNRTRLSLLRVQNRKSRSDRRLRFRKFAAEQNLNLVLLCTVPFTAAGGGFVFGYATSNSWAWAGVGAIAGALLSALQLRSYFFVPTDQRLSQEIANCDSESRRHGAALATHRAAIRAINAELTALCNLLRPLEYSLEERRRIRAREEERQQNSWENRANELLKKNWPQMRGIEFERFLTHVFQHLGYQVEGTSTSGDQGVDLIVRGSGQTLAVQAKGYRGSVGNSAVQQVYAGRRFYRCSTCAVVTNSRFTSSAQQLAATTDCKLIEADNMRDFVHGRIFPRLQ